MGADQHSRPCLDGRRPPGEQVAVPVRLHLEPARGALLEEPRAQLGLDGGERLPEVAAAGGGPPSGASSRHICSKSSRDSAMMVPMEFHDVVRRRRMVRNYTEEPVDPAIVDRALRERDPGPERRLQPGLGLPGARHPGRRTPLLGRHRRRHRPPRRVAEGHDACAGCGAVLEQGRLPGPLRRARQGLDRPRRSTLAGAVLAHGRRDGLAADPADRRRRRPRRLLLRHPAGQGCRGPRGVRDPRRVRPGRRDHAGPSRREAGSGRLAESQASQGPGEVVHRGSWGRSRHAPG